MLFKGIGVDAGEQLARAVAEALVQVGVQVVGDEQVVVEQLGRGGVDDELLVEAVAVGGLVIGLGDVLDGDRLGAVGGAYPVGVGEVDADGGGGVRVAGEHGGGDDLGRYALHLFLFEALVDGAVVLEPLGVVADYLGAVAGGDVLEVDNRLPRAGHAQRVAVALDKAVYVVDLRGGVLGPHYRVLVKGAQVAGGVVVDKLLCVSLLCVVLGVGEGLLQVLDNLFDGGRVKASDFVGLLHHLAVDLCHAGVEAVGDGGEVGGVLYRGVVSLDFGLGDVLVVEVRGRGADKVLAVGLVDALGVAGGIEDYVLQVGQHGLVGEAGGLVLLTEEVAAETGHEFVHRVVVVDAVAKPYLLEVLLEGLEVLAVAVARVIGVDFFEDGAQLQVGGVVLVPEDVAAINGGLG